MRLGFSIAMALHTVASCGFIAPGALAPPEPVSIREIDDRVPAPKTANDSAGDEPKAKPSEPASKDSPIYLFVNPADIETIWKRLKSPDWVLMSGKQYARLVEDKAGANRDKSNAELVVESVSANGKVKGDQAELVIEYQVSLGIDDPTWAPIGLDGQTLSRATESGKELPLRNRSPGAANDRPDPQAAAAGAVGVRQGGGWEVELSGKGTHKFQVRLLVPIKPTAEGERIEMAIPEAASTRISLDVPGKAAEAVAVLEISISSRSKRCSDPVERPPDPAVKPRTDLEARGGGGRSTPSPGHGGGRYRARYRLSGHPRNAAGKSGPSEASPGRSNSRSIPPTKSSRSSSTINRWLRNAGSPRTPRSSRSRSRIPCVRERPAGSR